MTRPSSSPRWSTWLTGADDHEPAARWEADPPPDELRCDPALVARLAEAARPIRGVRRRFVAGSPVIEHPRGRADRGGRGRGVAGRPQRSARGRAAGGRADGHRARTGLARAEPVVGGRRVRAGTSTSCAHTWPAPTTSRRRAREPRLGPVEHRGRGRRGRRAPPASRRVRRGGGGRAGSRRSRSSSRSCWCCTRSGASSARSRW